MEACSPGAMELAFSGVAGFLWHGRSLRGLSWDGESASAAVVECMQATSPHVWELGGEMQWSLLREVSSD